MSLNSTENPSFSLSQVRLAAMNLLAIREHSRGELRDKLGRKGFPQSLIDEALQGLIADKLQSDERFAEAFITMRYRQGKGPARIRQELREKQVSSDIIASLLDETDEIWVSLAREVKTRRFGTDSPQNLKERSKQMRFLQYRGFSPAQIQKLFR